MRTLILSLFHFKVCLWSIDITNLIFTIFNYTKGLYFLILIFALVFYMCKKIEGLFLNEYKVILLHILKDSSRLFIIGYFYLFIIMLIKIFYKEDYFNLINIDLEDFLLFFLIILCIYNIIKTNNYAPLPQSKNLIHKILNIIKAILYKLIYFLILREFMLQFISHDLIYNLSPVFFEQLRVILHCRILYLYPLIGSWIEPLFRILSFMSGFSWITQWIISFYESIRIKVPYPSPTNFWDLYYKIFISKVKWEKNKLLSVFPNAEGNLDILSLEDFTPEDTKRLTFFNHLTKIKTHNCIIQNTYDDVIAMYPFHAIGFQYTGNRISLYKYIDVFPNKEGLQDKVRTILSPYNNNSYLEVKTDKGWELHWHKGGITVPNRDEWLRDQRFFIKIKASEDIDNKYTCSIMSAEEAAGKLYYDKFIPYRPWKDLPLHKDREVYLRLFNSDQLIKLNFRMPAVVEGNPLDIRTFGVQIREYTAHNHTPIKIIADERALPVYVADEEYKNHLKERIPFAPTLAKDYKLIPTPNEYTSHRKMYRAEFENR